MGCKGSKLAEAPKTEPAPSTLLTKPDEFKGGAPETQASARGTNPKELVANASSQKAEEKVNEAPVTQGTALPKWLLSMPSRKKPKKSKGTPADAIIAKFQEVAEPQEAPKSTPDVTVTKAEDVKTGEPADEACATGQPMQVSNDEKMTTLDEVPIAAEGEVAGKIHEADAAGKAEVVESAASLAAADAVLAGKQVACFSYCTATEAQTEIVVQN